MVVMYFVFLGTTLYGDSHVFKSKKTFYFQYASVTEGDESFMTYADFIQRFLELLEVKDYNEYTLQLFGSSIDTSRDGYDTWYIHLEILS